jgi:iron complex outermembrane receptor protein
VDALIAFAGQAGLSIALDDPELRRDRTAGIEGDYDPAEALRRLLRGTGYDFVLDGRATARLIRRKPPRKQTAAPRVPEHPRVALQQAAPVEIVVQASKQDLSLANYPASISMLDLSRADAARVGSEGSAAIVRQMPTLASTNLGPGRNKIFIAGIADSSFNGASQSTISQYLGETRLIYSAPDPDLALYDIQRVEVLEGPQGTLYGAGTLGGIIRLVPRPPDPRAPAVELFAGTRLTQGGAPGYDVAAVANLPLLGDLAVRLVGYRGTEGGFIDDRLRGLANVNRNVLSGLRAALRWTPDAAWTIDLAAVLQSRGSHDGQYAQSDVGPLARRSAIGQPFDNDYALGSLTLTRSWGATRIVSATNYINHKIDSIFDATLVPGVTDPRAFAENVTVHLFSHETRLSGHFGGSGTWLVGVSAIDDRDHVARSLGAPGNPALLSNVTNATLDTAVFGQASVPFTPRLSLTVGGRLSYVHQSSQFSGSARTSGFEPTRSQTRALPTAMLAWKPNASTLIYGGYQEGFRPGALEFAGSGSTAAALRFEADTIRTFKVGMRFGMRPGAPVSGSLAASIAHWDDVQADLVGVDGLPYVANIGSGLLRNLSADLSLHLAPTLTVEASAFLNWSDLSHPAPAFTGAQDRDLPNIADAGWRLGARQRQPLGGAQLTLDGAIRYVGQSHLAIYPPFDLPQGRYYDVSAGARLGFGHWGITLDLDNALNSRANTFAYGNPFSVAAGTQRTPLRPRSIRIGVDAAF